MQQFPCPSCGKLLQVPETEAALESRCPACDAVFRPMQVMTEEDITTAAPRSPTVPVPQEQIQDLFLRPAARQESHTGSPRRRWLLFSVLLLPWCMLITLCMFGLLLDAARGLLQPEPGFIIGLGVFLAFGTSFLSLWMCSNSGRSVPDSEAGVEKEACDD